MGLGACDCPEAQLVRRLVAALDNPEGMLDQLASTLAVWKLRAMSHELSDANDWTRWRPPYSQRYEYDTPALTAEALHEHVAASWENWYRAKSTEWLTACAQQASADTPHGRLVLRILRERS